LTTITKSSYIPSKNVLKGENMPENKDQNQSQNPTESDQSNDKNKTRSKKKPMDKATRKRFVIQSATVLGKFYGLFAIFIALGYFLSRWDHTFHILQYSFNFKDFILVTFPGFLAASVGFVAELLGLEVRVHDVSVHFRTYNGFGYTIISDCAGYFVMLIFSAAVIAFPSRITDKIYGLLLGIPSLYFINVTRLVFIGLVCSKYHFLFDYLHEYMWQGIFIVFVIGIWIVWRQYIVRDDVPITKTPGQRTT
jgi:exosortase/archaeosortase family protein